MNDLIQRSCVTKWTGMYTLYIPKNVENYEFLIKNEYESEKRGNSVIFEYELSMGIWQWSVSVASVILTIILLQEAVVAQWHKGVSVTLRLWVRSPLEEMK